MSISKLGTLMGSSNKNSYLGKITWLFPLSVVYIPFMIIPVIGIFMISLFSGGSLTTLEFVGLDNYMRLFSSSVFHEVMKNTVLYAMANTILTVGGGLLLALAIQGTYKKLQSFFRVVFMVPYAIMGVGVGLIGTLMYHPRTGPINIYLGSIGIESPPTWLGDATYALPSVTAVTVWWTIGFYTIIWLVGLSSIDETYYEAARMDGANSIQTFRYITLPLLKPIGAFLLSISILLALREFAIFWATTQGGPGHASEVLVTWMFDIAFYQNNLGLGAAIGVVLFIFSGIVSLIVLRVFGVMED